MEYSYDEAKARIICELEKIIAKNVTTTSHTNGKYRYPVEYRKNGRNWRATGTANVDYDDIYSMHYNFGVHRLDIGMALDQILEFLYDKGLGNFDVYDDEE